MAPKQWLWLNEVQQSLKHSFPLGCQERNRKHNLSTNIPQCFNSFSNGADREIFLFPTASVSLSGKKWVKNTLAY